MKDLPEDNLFGSIRERLGRYEEAPPEELWGKIAASRKRRRVPVWIYSGAGVIALTMGVLLLNNEKKEDVVIEKEGVVEKPIVTPIVAPIAAQAPLETPVVVAKLKVEPTQQVVEHVVPATPEVQITNRESEIKQDSAVVSSPLVSKTDSVFKSTEVVPPYKKPKSKFQFYISATPSLSFQKIIPGSNDAIIVQGLTNRSPFSMKRFGFAIDAGVQYDLNKYFGFYGGLSFYHQQQQLTYNYYDKDGQVTRTGDGWTFEIDRPQRSKTFDYTMTNLGAQGGVMITLKGEKLKHKFGAGLNYTHSLNSSSSYLAYQLFYRNEIKINDRFSWFVEPMFTYSFIATEKLDEPFRLKPYRAGITGGVLYRFK